MPDRITVDRGGENAIAAARLNMAKVIAHIVAESSLRLNELSFDMAKSGPRRARDLVLAQHWMGLFPYHTAAQAIYCDLSLAQAVKVRSKAYD